MRPKLQKKCGLLFSCVYFRFISGRSQVYCRKSGARLRGREENPSCQRSSTTERGVKGTPTFSTTDRVRRGCRQKRSAKTSRDSPSHYQRRDRKAASLAAAGLANNGGRQCEQTRRGSKPPDFRIGAGRKDQHSRCYGRAESSM